MRHILILIALASSLTACAVKPPDDTLAGTRQAETVEDAAGADTEAELLVAAPPPPPEARTAEALDTTTIEQRAEAAAPPEAGAPPLGRTVVSLGSPTDPGFWLETPLVREEADGRVTNPANGKSSAVRLKPIDGPPTAGSRLSLSAMRLIELPLTELSEVEVSLDAE